MRVTPVLEDLTQYQTYAEHIGMTFNQYLLGGETPLLIHTGDTLVAGHLAEALIPALKGRPLSLVFISHFESDECGGLGFWLKKYPQAKAVCSEVTARQLAGFGITTNVVIKKPGETLHAGGFDLRFFGYPSEMHLWEGLLAFETRRKTLFCADLFGRRGAVPEAIQAVAWPDEVESITPMQIPSPQARSAVQVHLRTLQVEFVAPGHGPVLRTALTR